MKLGPTAKQPLQARNHIYNPDAVFGPDNVPFRIETCFAPQVLMPEVMRASYPTRMRRNSASRTVFLGSRPMYVTMKRAGVSVVVARFVLRRAGIEVSKRREAFEGIQCGAADVFLLV
jgi:hypothetical protein